ncbi:sugar phosphate isomerase/epimerase family protein [Nonomuraea sp. NPDC049028]|uniref:sugar phosphate isomerase/epimerase family protein n=1 Tax=Nonomuraea sp. NPDC049028 TaxID=3364348 RepID=UPI003710D935
MTLREPQGAALPEVGVFARTFPRDTAAEVADAVAAAGFTLAQFNFSAIATPTLAPDVSAATVASVGQTFRDAGVSLWGLSATYNIINPDQARRTEQTHDAARLIRLSPALEVTAVTLCSGTRNADNMWADHPDNRSPAAWADLRTTLDTLLEAAAEAGVTLGIEPEPTNVIDSAERALRLITELGADARHVGIVLDPANLVTARTLDHQRDIFDEAFDLLGEHIIGLQAKDLTAAGPAPLGRGELDHSLICDRALQLDHPVPIIIQDAADHDAARAGTYLREQLDTAGRTRRDP